MSILHYFSKDPNKRAKFIFNFIAPLYHKLDKTIEKGFLKTVELLQEEIILNEKSVIDIGTGTGAWGGALLKSGAESAHGVDFSRKMLLKNKTNHPKMTFEYGDAENLENIKDNSFDIVTASFVLHGVKEDRRNKILSEMERISKKYIVINDFIGKTPIFIRFLEFMEKSDYKNFKQNFCNELKTRFINVHKIQSGYGTGLYIGLKSSV